MKHLLIVPGTKPTFVSPEGNEWYEERYFTNKANQLGLSNHIGYQVKFTDGEVLWILVDQNPKEPEVVLSDEDMNNFENHLIAYGLTLQGA